MRSDRTLTLSVENVDFTMERNAQRMAKGTESADNTIIGSKCAEINKCVTSNPDHHLSSSLKAEDHKTKQSNNEGQK